MAKPCKTCPLLTDQLKHVAELARRVDEEAVLAKVQADMENEGLRREVNNLLLENARIRKDYRDFLDQITWQKAELNG